MVTHTHNPIMLCYLAGWIGFCCVAGGVVFRDLTLLRNEWRRYWRFLTIPWKVTIFVPAFVFVTFAGRFTDDETWDSITGGGMSVLTYLSAPWCLGVLFQCVTGQRPKRYYLVALALLLFSSSWFYDGYLLLRDGAYTSRWWSNLMLSPIIYVTAGVLWNLEAQAATVISLGFLRHDWPSPSPDRRLWPILVASIPLMAIAGFVLVAFVRWTGGPLGR
jgi:hypothetical protein